MTSAEWTPSLSASAQAASTAGRPSLSAALRISTIWRSPFAAPWSFRRTRFRDDGGTQSLNGAFAIVARTNGATRLTARGAGFAGQRRNVAPGVIDRVASPEHARVPADNTSFPPELDPLGIGPDLDRAPNRAGADRIAVTVEPHEAGLGDRSRDGVEPVEGSDVGREACPFRLEHLPDRLVPHLRMRVRLGPGDASVEQPGVQLRIVLEPQPRREEPPAHHADLVLDLPFLPTRRRRAGDRIDQIVATHLLEPAIVGALLAHEDHVYRRLHIIVHTTRLSYIYA